MEGLGLQTAWDIVVGLIATIWDVIIDDFVLFVLETMWNLTIHMILTTFTTQWIFLILIVIFLKGFSARYVFN